MAPPNPQHVILLHHLRRLLLAAAERGIDVAPLKGAHLVTSVYAPGEDRGAMGDVDLLVRPRDWAAARALVAELGFTPRPTEPWLPAEEHSHEAGFELPVGGRKILFEVHRYLFDPLRLPIDHDALWARSAESSLDGAPCRRLAPEDHFVHQVLHALVHRLGQLRRTLDDLERLVRRGGVNLEVVVGRAREWRAQRATWLMLELLAERAPEIGCGTVAGRLAPSAPLRRLIRKVVPGEGPHRFARLHHRVQAALLWPLLFDSAGDVVRLVAAHPAVQRLRG